MDGPRAALLSVPGIGAAPDRRWRPMAGVRGRDRGQRACSSGVRSPARAGETIGVSYFHSMRISILILILILAVLAPAAGAHRQTPSSPAAGFESPRALVDQYCVGCHNDTLKTA